MGESGIQIYPALACRFQIVVGQLGYRMFRHEWNNHMHTPLVSAIVCTSFKIKEIPAHMRRTVAIPIKTSVDVLRAKPKQCA